LIWYARPDEDAPKASDYLLITIDDPATLRHALQVALGIRAVVEKRREIFFRDNVRIHLDLVTSLGDFIEFEAVLGPDHTDQEGHEQLKRLIDELGLSPTDFLSGSYGELIMS